MEPKLARNIIIVITVILLAACRLSANDAETMVDAGVMMPEANINYYPIRGETAGELRAAMDDYTLPSSPDGIEGDARTDWYFRWNWPGYGTSNCDLSRAETSYTITVTLPDWDFSESTDPQLVADWTRYYNALANHENGHVRRALEYYAKLLPAIQNATCETAEAAAQIVLSDLASESQKYDDVTHHGTTEGAVFP